MNRQFESYFIKALHDAKIDELVQTYSKRGYVAQRETPQDRGGFDLVLHEPSKNRTVVFEVKFLPMDEENLQSVEALRQKAVEKGYDFRLVTIARPVRYSIEIDWLESALLQYIIEDPVQEIEELATHVQYQGVGVDIDSLKVSDDVAIAEVHGTIDIELQYGSRVDLSADIGMVMGYSIPFEGKLELDMTAQAVNSMDIKVDLSDWEGEYDES